MILFLVMWAPNFIRYHLQGGARLFQMLPRLMDGRIIRFPLAAHNFQRGIDLLSANPPQVGSQCLIASQLITHRFIPAPVARCCNVTFRLPPPRTSPAGESAGILSRLGIPLPRRPAPRYGHDKHRSRPYVCQMEHRSVSLLSDSLRLPATVPRTDRG